MSKKRVAIIFGGASTEYEVSLKSATCVINNIPKSRYKPVLIGISKKGEWFLYEDDVSKIEDGTWIDSSKNKKAFVSPDKSFKGIVVLSNDGTYEKINIDAAFAVLHGKNGEDGSIQGLFQLAGIPLVGCSMNSSVECMDKTLTNIMLDHAGIKQANFLWIYSYNVIRHKDICVTYIENNMGEYPYFIKPASAGSSVGVSKVHNTNELRKALMVAAAEDEKILVEENVIGREIECAVMGNGEDLEASILGEIAPSNEFYDYDAKYISNNSGLYIPANISEEKSNEIKAIAKEAYMLLGCSGLARVDFFLKENGEVYLNEVNTIPGFTDISMYPKLMEETGIPIDQQIDRLISLALERTEK